MLVQARANAGWRRGRRQTTFSVEHAWTRASLVGRKQPRSSREQVRPRVFDAAARRAAQGMPADERQAFGQRPRGVDHRALRAAGVGDDGARRRRCLPGRAESRGSVGWVRQESRGRLRRARSGSSAATSMACSTIARSSTSLRSTPMTRPAGHDLSRRQRDRSADQTRGRRCRSAERPAAGPARAGLQHRQL